MSTTETVRDLVRGIHTRLQIIHGASKLHFIG
jgi:hypothetical protein